MQQQLIYLSEVESHNRAGHIEAQPQKRQHDRQGPRGCHGDSRIPQEHLRITQERKRCTTKGGKKHLKGKTNYKKEEHKHGHYCICNKNKTQKPSPDYVDTALRLNTYLYNQDE
jgi:hypothetical protein